MATPRHPRDTLEWQPNNKGGVRLTGGDPALANMAALAAAHYAAASVPPIEPS